MALTWEQGPSEGVKEPPVNLFSNVLSLLLARGRELIPRSLGQLP